MADLVERDVKLFEAGDYPDKGKSYTEEDLDRWVEAHNGIAIPFSVGHLLPDENPLAGDSGFGMGWVEGLYRRGRELWGKLKIGRWLNDVIEKSPFRDVSVCLSRDRIVEVSWVKDGRVPGAQLFHFSADGTRFDIGGALGFAKSLDDYTSKVRAAAGSWWANEYPDETGFYVVEVFDEYVVFQSFGSPSTYRCDYTETGGKFEFSPRRQARREYVMADMAESEEEKMSNNNSGGPQPVDETRFAELEQRAATAEAQLASTRSQLAALEEKYQRNSAEQRVDEFIAAGKLLPAQRDKAVELLSHRETVKFSDGTEVSVGEAIESLIDSIDPVALFEAQPGARTRLPKPDDESQIQDEEKAYLATRMKGLTFTSDEDRANAVRRFREEYSRVTKSTNGAGA